MIRAWIGAFVLGCIAKAKQQEHDAIVRRVDLSRMNDREISAFIHGRRIDWDAVDRRIAGSRGIEP